MFQFRDVDRHAQHGAVGRVGRGEGDLGRLQDAVPALGVDQGFLRNELELTAVDHGQVVPSEAIHGVGIGRVVRIGRPNQLFDRRAERVGHRLIRQQEAALPILGKDQMGHQIDDLA